MTTRHVGTATCPACKGEGWERWYDFSSPALGSANYKRRRSLCEHCGGNGVVPVYGERAAG